jgi:hypothetical protein
LKSLSLVVVAASTFLCAAGNIQAEDPDSGAAAAYCQSTGGVVVERAPVYGTNGPTSQWLVLAGTRKFCKYTSATDGSRIHILLETLYATKPSLAVLAYYAKLPLGTGCTGNPASCYCSQLEAPTCLAGSMPRAAAGSAMTSRIPCSKRASFRIPRPSTPGVSPITVMAMCAESI